MHESIERQPAHSSSKMLTQRPKPERPLNLRDTILERLLSKLLIGAGVAGFLLMVLFATITDIRDQKLFQRLQQAGEKVEAEVIGRSDIGRGQERLAYRFTAVSQGTTKSFSASDVVDRTKDGSRATGRITIIYDPADPRRSRVLSELRPPTGVLPYLVGYSFFGWPLPLTGLFMLRAAERRYKVAQQLEQAGQLAQGGDRRSVARAGADWGRRRGLPV
jgi:hypothetical protein